MSSGIEAQVLQPYKYGFVTDIESDVVPPGLSEDVIRLISTKKGEPEWMLEWRLKAYRNWLKMAEPHWSNVTYGPIDYQAISYYAAPKQRPKLESLDQVDPKLIETFEKLGIPIEERKRLAGVAVDAVFDSVSVATTFRETLARQGIIFCAISPRTPGSTRRRPDRSSARSSSPKKGATSATSRGVPRRSATSTSCTRPSWSSWRWTTPRSSTRPSRTGTRGTRRAAAGSTTSSPSAARAAARTRRSPGRRSRPARRSPGSIT